MKIQQEMGFRGFMRSYSASVRRSERAQQRRSREAVKQYKLMEKQQEIAQATDIVAAYNAYIEVFKSIHKSCNDDFSWKSMLNERPPIEPTRKNKHEQVVRDALFYKKAWIDKFFGLGKFKEREYHKAMAIAKAKDDNDFDIAMVEYGTEKEDYLNGCRIAKLVLDKNPEGYQAAFQEMNPILTIEIGASINMIFESDKVIVDFSVKDQDVIPNFIIAQLATGKLSKKAMPKAQFNEIYQDYVCGYTLRIAREVFAFLPVNAVEVNAIADMVSSVTGHVEKTLIASIIMPRQTILRLNFDAIDPSDSFRNFIHNMNFSKTHGFKPVEKVKFYLS